MLVANLAQIALHVNADLSLTRETFHYFGRKIVAEQRAEVEDTCLKSLHLFHGEGVALGEYPLGTSIAVVAVFVFKEDGLLAVEGNHIDTFSLHPADGLTVFLGDGGHHLERNIVGQMVDAVGEIVGRTAVLIECMIGRDDLI